MKYRKKPVVIEALQWLGHNWNEMCDFIPVPDAAVGHLEGEEMLIKIKTLEGEMTANMNDYIIKGVNGEFYPCKPDIFEKTYEKVD
ncbi:hypothetical protein H1D32_13330 [Anaerobacillus sp. CMMVII]|uniref:hypothetical protein n=1 Tax=Anaerobacillus sp. CMMVII TaxID=2755588 RepID=UPI0021B7B0AF|nr:hypothetical protein [Anaerobacillus sp. CMMVII]MCT8138636.1 hypothetical protein [Anaerobacillus sp. CMMVII]